jgi:hypothetical protein
MRPFCVTPGRLAVFLAVLALGMIPTRVAFAQG